MCRAGVYGANKRSALRQSPHSNGLMLHRCNALAPIAPYALPSP
jgi:hypothetical protein